MIRSVIFGLLVLVFSFFRNPLNRLNEEENNSSLEFAKSFSEGMINVQFDFNTARCSQIVKYAVIGIDKYDNEYTLQDGVADLNGIDFLLTRPDCVIEMHLATQFNDVSRSFKLESEKITLTNNDLGIISKNNLKKGTSSQIPTCSSFLNNITWLEQLSDQMIINSTAPFSYLELVYKDGQLKLISLDQEEVENDGSVRYLELQNYVSEKELTVIESFRIYSSCNNPPANEGVDYIEFKNPR